MKAVPAVCALLVTLTGCEGGNPYDNLNGGIGGSSGTLYLDGASKTVVSCNEAATRIRNSVELGMSKADVRAIVGKPRHIAPEGEDWRYGTNISLGGGDTPDGFYNIIYTLPAANFPLRGINAPTSTFLDDFSGDNTECDDSDLSFVEAANSYSQVAGNVDFTNDISLCYDAAVRIAATVEQGMSLSQVRALVGKPIEVANDGTWWRYQFGAINAPYVFFTQYGPSSPYIVTGYSSITTSCQ